MEYKCIVIQGPPSVYSAQYQLKRFCISDEDTFIGCNLLNSPEDRGIKSFASVVSKSLYRNLTLNPEYSNVTDFVMTIDSDNYSGGLRIRLTDPLNIDIISDKVRTVLAELAEDYIVPGRYNFVYFGENSFYVYFETPLTVDQFKMCSALIRQRQVVTCFPTLIYKFPSLKSNSYIENLLDF